HGALNTSDETYYNDLVQTLQRDKEDLVAQRDLLQTELEALRGSSDGLVSPQDMRAMVARMEQERARLEADREQMASRLADIQEQLEAAGVETGPGGLAQLISQLTEQRGTLVSENETLRREVERLQSAAAEVADIDDAAREERIHLLENTLKNLASDREAAIKQRDHIRKELDEFKHKLTVLRARWKDLEAKLERAQKELKISQQQRNKLQDEIWQMANQRSELVNLRDRLAAEKQAVETERDQLLARIEGDRSRVEELGATGVGSLTGMIEDLTEQRQSLENQLQQAQIRISELESTLERARAEAFDQADVRYRPDNPDLLLGLVQELRTPMTSITGYVDLLLGESAGILGEMQRKFLQRVSTNVTRLDSMLDDLIKVTELDTGHYRFTPVPVNVNNLIEDAITHASNQFREKGLTVSLALDDTLPPVQVDRDAISQIVGQLLTNAYLASPPDSEIIIRSEARDADLWGIGAVECLIVSVEDRGGGISPEDEPRVFARKYKAENPLIQGLGDTGVGLSIAKALVESQGGRLWLETRENVGSTFTFLLPFVPIQNPQQAAEAEPNDAS
ncbi:MAG: ATP-binding protein, partial [Chloroflexota bacterium]